MQIAILIVDDEEMVRNNLAAYFEDEGMKVTGVASFEEACDLDLTNKNFNVCIMDMRLPGLDGNAAILELNKICPKLRFIVHTGSSDYVLPTELRRIGMEDKHVFAKPMIDMGPMAETIRQLVE